MKDVVFEVYFSQKALRIEIEKVVRVTPFIIIGKTSLYQILSLTGSGMVRPRPLFAS